MAKFEVGKKYKSKQNQQVWECLHADDNAAFLRRDSQISDDGYEYRSARHIWCDINYEVVVPTFEVGKSYRYASRTGTPYLCVYRFEDTDRAVLACKTNAVVRTDREDRPWWNEVE